MSTPANDTPAPEAPAAPAPNPDAKDAPNVAPKTPGSIELDAPLNTQRFS